MTAIAETEEWADGVYQFEETDFVEGGAEGVDNLPHRQLGSRTLWLRKHLGVGLRDASFLTLDGYPCQMVYLPRFRLPAGLIAGWPSVDMELGGFFVDKYPCSHRSATPSARGIGANPTVEFASEDVAVSRPGVVAWTDITLANARTACANRVINGVRAHLMTGREWAAVVLFGRLLGLDVFGNTASGGRDARHPNTWEYQGVPDPVQAGRVLVGSGPVSWSNNQQASGIFDLLGNIGEMLDMEIEDCVYRHRMAAALDDADGISDVDESITLDGIAELEHWPVANGLVLISGEGANTDEYVRYAAFTDNQDGSITLTGCTRAQEGTSASAHSNDAVVECLVDRCIMPAGAKTTVGSGLNNTTDPVTFNRGAEILYGPNGQPIAEGDILAVEAELLEVTGVNGLALTCARGYNGSTPASHANATAVVKVSSAGTWNLFYPTMRQGYFAAMDDDAIMRSFAFPGLLTGLYAESILGSESPADAFWAYATGQRMAVRGSGGRYGFSLAFDQAPTYHGPFHGFRACLTLG